MRLPGRCIQFANEYNHHYGRWPVGWCEYYNANNGQGWLIN